MKAALEEIMSQVTIETLEKLAFMFAFPAEGAGDQAEDSTVTGEVSFSGPFSGTLVITISVDVLKELTANMLGIDDEEESTESQRSDALKETMNIVCGNLLPAIGGDQVVFDIGVPEVLPSMKDLKDKAGIPKESTPSARVTLELDEGKCLLFLFLDGGIPENLVLPQSR